MQSSETGERFMANKKARVLISRGRSRVLCFLYCRFRLSSLRS